MRRRELVRIERSRLGKDRWIMRLLMKIERQMFTALIRQRRVPPMNEHSKVVYSALALAPWLNRDRRKRYRLLSRGTWRS